jgi:hypothetical protein
VNDDPHAVWHRAQSMIVAAEAAEVRRREHDATARAKARAEQKRLAGLPVLEREAIAIRAAGSNVRDRMRAQVAFWVAELRCTVTYLDGWSLKTDRSFDRQHRPCAFLGPRPHVNIPAVVDSGTFAVSMHELGHVATYRPGMTKSQRETEAWWFARKRSCVWLPASEHALHKSLSTYSSYAERGDGLIALVNDARACRETSRRLAAMAYDDTTELVTARVPRQRAEFDHMHRRKVTTK